MAISHASYLPGRGAEKRGPGGWFLALGLRPNAVQRSRASRAGKARARCSSGLANAESRSGVPAPEQGCTASSRAASPPAGSADRHLASTDRPPASTKAVCLERALLFLNRFKSTRMHTRIFKM